MREGSTLSGVSNGCIKILHSELILMKLSCILDGIEIEETNIIDLEVEINSVCEDSREVNSDDIFVALCGSRYDGHKYIGEALGRRAAVIVIEKKHYSGAFPYIRVKNTRKALAMLWHNLTGRAGDTLKLIAVTGTNGKSSVCRMIRQILEAAGHSCEEIGTLTNAMTTPDPHILYPKLKEFSENDTEYVVMEASSHALELYKLEPLKFKIAIFTNLTEDHLDFHHTMRSYAKAKARLFEKTEIGLFNRDDPFLKQIMGSSKCEKYFYGVSDAALDFSAKNSQSTLEGTQFDFLTLGEIFRVRFSLIGDFNIINGLCACSCAYLLGIEKEHIKAAFAKMKTVPGRLERVELPHSVYRAYIDYAHTPDALEKVLYTLRKTASEKQRIVCIFGCGGDREKAKRPIMGAIATRLSDYVIITSDNPRSEEPFAIIRDIVSGVGSAANYLIIADRTRAIQYAVHSAAKNDILIFCGKGHEKYEINNYGRFPFDEIKVIKEADTQRNGREK